MSSLPNYTLARMLYEDADVSLYQGFRRSDHAPVTIKLPRSEYPSARDIARLRYEHAITRLDLTGIVRSHNLEKCGPSLALILDDLGGPLLHHVIQRERLDLALSLRTAISLADTLESLHRSSIVHKDIKPSNIVLRSEAGHARLTGFSIAARLAQETQRPRRITAMEGTLAYMSPEQTGRMNRVIDHRADLYSLGVTLYELLTGVLPFQSTDPLELVHSHVARRPAAPHELAPGVPRAVSDIVMKLLSKAAEDRYQRASGLKADLEACLHSWESARTIAPFPLGKRDVSGELRISQKLYGREAELGALTSAWARASEGSAGLLLVSGYSGVGKSALVHEIYSAIARRGGYLAASKFDQLSRSTPYAAVAHALRELVRQILEEQGSALAVWRSKLEAALGQNGRVLVDLVPEVELCIGPQPGVPELGPTESQNRLALVFQRFIRVTADAERPLVIFLDDMQWADPASLKLLELLLTDRESRHLLVIGAYRDNEVDAAHRLSLTLGELRKAGAAMQEIKLRPLDISDVNRLVADTLSCGSERAAPLAGLVFDKTAGNPFFITQLLRALHQRGLLAFDTALSSWRWDIAGVEAAGFTDNVVALMVSKLDRLAPATQRVLRLAACIGHRFDLKTLSLISEQPPGDTAAALWEALAAGLVLPLDPDYRYLHDSDAEGRDTASETFNITYGFLHDRVQQAAYSLIEDDRKQEVHLRIGRLMWESSHGALRDDELFDIANHMNIGASLITAPQERLSLARLNLTVGKRAKASAAYDAAAAYLRAGASLLDEGSFEHEYDLSFKLLADQAECEYLTGAFDRAESLFDTLLSRARSDLDRAHVYNLRILVYSTLGRFQQALGVGLTGLKLFGIELPEDEPARQAAFEEELSSLRARLQNRRIEALLDAAPMTDPSWQAVLKLLTNITSPAYLISRTLFAIVVIKHVSTSLDHGHSDVSAYGYANYGFILSTILDQHAEAFAFGELALALNERLNNVDLSCKLNFLVGEYIHFSKPLRSVLPYYARAYEDGLESGDFPYLSYSGLLMVITRLGIGDDLEEVRALVDKLLTLMARTKDTLSTAALTVSRQMIACLQGHTNGRSLLSDGAFDEREFVTSTERVGLTFVLCWYYRVKLELLVLHGDHEGALAVVPLAEEASASSTGLYHTTDVPFYACLALLGHPPGEGPLEQGRRAATVAAHQARLASWAEQCPENYRHKQLLVLAELARVAGRDHEAAELYDRAIASAQQHGFSHHEALANELCARFYLSRERPKIARVYMTDAYYGYLHWGAAARAEELSEKLPHLLIQRAAAPASDAVSPPAMRQVTAASVGPELLDMAAIMKGAQAIAGEIVIGKVIDRLMRVVIENAGAQKGFLLLTRDDRLEIEAAITLDPDVVRVGLSLPLDESAELARTVVEHVHKSGRPVILGDAAADSAFAGDPYIAARRPRSILCLAMTHRGRLTGILYLENNAVANAFTPGRIETCGLLSSQAAIAVEHALFNERLENKVSRRTEELRLAYEQLERELAERERSEEARAALKEEIIRVQHERFLELSTPLIPITDRIMVMPLIGTLDASRAEQVLVTALEGAQTRRADVVIIDITGVKQVDAEISGMLTRTAQALKLLGAQAVITGISASVAQMLVERNVDLGTIMTTGSLQSGIAYALRRSSESFGQSLDRARGRA